MFGLGKSTLDRGIEAFTAQNWRQARRLLEEAAHEQPTAEGDYHLGLLYWRGLGGNADPRAGAALFERSARAGHVAGQTAFAVALRSGSGVRRDAEEARKLFRSAAGGDDVDAMLQLASMSDHDEAKHWLERAAGHGHPLAMVQLSDLMLQADPIAALGWLYASATLTNNEAARKRAAAMALELSASEIETAQKQGRAIVKHLQTKTRGKR